MTSRIVALTGCFVATYAFLAQASKAEPTPIREPLASLPLTIGEWSGRPGAPLSEAILAVLRVDDHTSRVYLRGDTAVGFYVGYHASQRQGASIHSPLNCLPGAGWLPVETAREGLTVPTAAGTPRAIEVNKVVIQRGVDRQLVLYWYQSHGRVVASEYWGKFYSVLDAIRYNRTDAALVRVTVPIAAGSDENDAHRAAVAFASELFPLLERHLPS